MVLVLRITLVLAVAFDLSVLVRWAIALIVALLLTFLIEVVRRCVPAGTRAAARFTAG